MVKDNANEFEVRKKDLSAVEVPDENNNQNLCECERANVSVFIMRLGYS